MSKIADINILICTYLDIRDISNLLRASRKIYEASRVRITIEKVIIRNDEYSDTKIYVRKVSVLDKYENRVTTDGVRYIVNDFGYICFAAFAMNPKRYVIYMDKYCRAKVIFGYNSSDWSSHELTVASKWMDIFSLYHLHYSYVCTNKQDVVEDLDFHLSKGASRWINGVFIDKLLKNNINLRTFLSTHTDKKIIDFIRNI